MPDNVRRTIALLRRAGKMGKNVADIKQQVDIERSLEQGQETDAVKNKSPEKEAAIHPSIIEGGAGALVGGLSGGLLGPKRRERGAVPVARGECLITLVERRSRERESLGCLLHVVGDRGQRGLRELGSQGRKGGRSLR